MFSNGIQTSQMLSGSVVALCITTKMSQTFGSIVLSGKTGLCNTHYIVSLFSSISESHRQSHFTLMQTLPNDIDRANLGPDEPTLATIHNIRTSRPFIECLHYLQITA